MLKKTIKFTDYNGNEVEEDHYFNLTKAEAIELNIRNDLEVIGRSRNNNETMDTFKRILQMSYGVRTGDGKFLKEPRDFSAFAASEAYSELFMQIWTDADYALEFIRGILPAEIAQQEGLQKSQSDIPTHLQNHPSMQGRRAAQQPQSTPAPSEPELRQQAYPGQIDVNTTIPAETKQEMEARIRLEIQQEYASQPHYPTEYQAPIVPTTPPATGVTTPEQAQQSSTSRDELI